MGGDARGSGSGSQDTQAQTRLDLRDRSGSARDPEAEGEAVSVWLMAWMTSISLLLAWWRIVNLLRRVERLERDLLTPAEKDKR